MRGRPLIELLMFAAVWALMLLPVLHVTGGRKMFFPTSDDAGLSVDETALQGWLTVRFSEAPLFFKIYADDIVVWDVNEPETDMDELLVLKSEARLRLDAHWSTPGRRAIELLFEPLEGPPRRFFVWSDFLSFHQTLDDK